DDALSQLPRALYDGASLLPLALARATPDLPRARALLLRLKPEALARGEAVCPTRVPLRGIAAFLQRRLRDLDEIVAATSGPGRGPGDPAGAGAPAAGDPVRRRLRRLRRGVRGAGRDLAGSEAAGARGPGGRAALHRRRGRRRHRRGPGAPAQRAGLHPGAL